MSKYNRKRLARRAHLAARMIWRIYPKIVRKSMTVSFVSGWTKENGLEGVQVILKPDKPKHNRAVLRDFINIKDGKDYCSYSLLQNWL